MRRLRYPDKVLRQVDDGEIPSGEFLFEVIVGPDGTTQPPRLVRRALTLAESAYRPADIEAVEAAASYALGALRFAPELRYDTLTIPITFPRWK